LATSKAAGIFNEQTRIDESNSLFNLTIGVRSCVRTWVQCSCTICTKIVWRWQAVILRLRLTIGKHPAYASKNNPPPQLSWHGVTWRKGGCKKTRDWHVENSFPRFCALSHPRIWSLRSRISKLGPILISNSMWRRERTTILREMPVTALHVEGILQVPTSCEFLGEIESRRRKIRFETFPGVHSSNWYRQNYRLRETSMILPEIPTSSSVNLCP
jgi:hypothetical protein